MILINTEVQKTDLSPVKDLIWCDHKDFDRITEHYPLLGYLSLQYPDGSKFLDIGTRRGASAVSMSLNPKVDVDSYDITNCGTADHIKADNIAFHIGNLWDDLNQVLNRDVILLDIDPHVGTLEMELVQFLKDNDWRGVLIIDDICDPPWRAMRQMWEKIDVVKYDVTSIAHASGTGIVDYGNNLKVEL
jgi:hypothetical protein